MGAAVRKEGARTAGALPYCLLAAIMASGCGSLGASPALRHTAPSVHALTSAVLSAFAAGDVSRLDDMAVTEEEFRAVVWAGLPASRPEAAVPVDYAWSDLQTKSRSGMRETLNIIDGEQFELLSVRFTGRVSDHGTFRIYRDSLADVRGGDGVTRRLRLFGSVIEYAGRVKVFSYIVD